MGILWHISTSFSTIYFMFMQLYENHVAVLLHRKSYDTKQFLIFIVALDIYYVIKKYA